MSNRVLILTDTHIGSRGGSRHFRELFRQYFIEVLFPYIVENNIKTVLHAGDVFDNRSSLSLHDIDFMLNEFIPAFIRTGAHMYMIAGNHDVAYRNTNMVNSLSIFKNFPDYFTVYDDSIGVVETEGKDFVLCPWLNNENEERLSEDMKFYADKDHILVGHFEVQGAKMYKNSKVCEHGLQLEDFGEYDSVLSGHFHHPSRYGKVEYIGATFHLNWQDHNDWRGFRVYDPSSDSYELHENEFSLFTEMNFHGSDLVNMEDQELKDYTEGQIVRIVVDQEYDRVDMKDVVSRIEKNRCISVDVIDKTILDSTPEIEYNDGQTDEETVKEIETYADEVLKDNPEKDAILELFKDVKAQAKERMKEIE